MKKSFKLMMALLLISSFVLSFSSCKDSENVTDDPNSPENIALSKETESARALKSFLSFTSGLDSLPDNWASNNFTIEANVGVVNDKANPYVRYIPVLNKEEAITQYNSFAVQSISNNATSGSWSGENVGSLSFKVLDQADVTATLDVNIKQLPHLTQIRFVPASALGENARMDGEPYYTFGDVIELTEGTNKSYWICARPCSKLEAKTTSHWLSFNLNDIDAKSPAVPNFKKFTKNKYYDYYLPTKLGNESESLIHLQNLFKLLKIIDNPQTAQYFNITENGFGGLKEAEFSELQRTNLSTYWNERNIWNKILPKEFSSTDLNYYLETKKAVNVFYNGHSYKGTTPHVWMAKLTGDDLQCEAKYLEWKRTVSGVDFRNYAEKGRITNNDTGVLPDNGLIVRYKTGAELIDKTRSLFLQESPNDEAPEESFTKKHSNTIKDIFVYKEVKKSIDGGSSVMGDLITNEDNSKEVCVLSYSDKVPAKWGHFSYYFKLWEPSNQDDYILQEKDISTLAYIHLLNAIILKSDEYSEYCATQGDILNLPSYYKAGLTELYNNLSAITGGAKELKNLVKFEALDKDGKVVTDNNVKNLDHFVIALPYKDKSLATGFKDADLLFDVKTEKYGITSNANVHTSVSHGILSLKAYTDVNSTKPMLSEGQAFTESITSNRQFVKAACFDFINPFLVF